MKIKKIEQIKEDKKNEGLKVKTNLKAGDASQIAVCG